MNAQNEPLEGFPPPDLNPRIDRAAALTDRVGTAIGAIGGIARADLADLPPGWGARLEADLGRLAALATWLRQAVQP